MNNISVAILWHFHQPIYSKPNDTVLPLPWVRLHCIKDYLDMLKHVQKFPDIQVTFNFTPSLLLQIHNYKTGECTDRQFLLFKKKAEELIPEERIEILRDFFLANWKEMIEPYPRYFELLLKRGKNIVEEELMSIAENFTVDELRDLQIWANLSWIDPMFRDDIGDLYKKGKNFSEADKERIITLEKQVIDDIFTEYKKALQQGQIEITTSPLYHPILPLLINTSLAKVSRPNLVLPFEFAHPEDAKHHIIEGIQVFKKIFGQEPTGMWPPEGAVCEELISIVSSSGIEWIASDDEILARSLNTSFRRDEQGVPNHPELLYQPWKIDTIKVLFRDHILSDLIGFLYHDQDQTETALDLITRIKHIGNSLPPFGKFVIPIILDGENAWEHYKNDATDFIETLYENLIKEEIPTTTIGKYLRETEVKDTLPSLFPGSWIGAHFNMWIGQPEDHQAWQVVKHLRDMLVEKKIDDKKIWDKFYMLEGSDWFWWFGSSQVSHVVEVFDELFRQNAIWIYKKIGEEPPPELFSPIKKISEALTYQSIDTITPVIDGKLTHFYEWYKAGHADVRRMGGTMHYFAGIFSTVYCGFDDTNLYIRFDVENHDVSKYQYSIKFYKPKEVEFTLGESKESTYKIEDIGEVAIPLSLLGVDNQGIVEFIVRVWQEKIEIDRTPLLKFSVKLSDVRLHNWIV
ncbi:hypothetical protein AMJ52_09650 [candidate division TA06 bacterium DG_78]|uniref:Glycoside hydrolase family 57 N-terminal domain-containing protein n=1 Tax=candidate division TA06 bacterium DG_78 TaxID=1703772 RepID=A0A0S7Y949_UNCT6|nr:MAG: hypothetical protein AMJ52_09650 [candidate division TA06 bacterium DG_78]